MTAPRVNLLPHRAAKRERQKKLFWALTGLAAVAGLFMVGAVWTVLQGYIANQEARNEFIRAENRKLDTQIKEIATLRQEIDGLRARQRAVEDLQADRNQPVYLLDEIAKQVPEGIYLRSIKQEDRRVNVTGWAASNERVSEFLRNLQNNSRVLERPELVEIKVAGQGPAGMNRRVFEFGLYFTMKPTPERTQMQQAQARPVATGPASPAAATGAPSPAAANAAPTPTVATAAPTPSAAPAAPKK
ncbi:MAG TPA: PilN domain-containing protein [Burkholderiaceae bacterium]|jgi:type IV pilus assembly protein PilN|nr:PilN domain-containing protein [Burkholderiaceae bacterium]